MSENKQPSIENTLEQLESLVEKMESGELSLEDSLAAFEKGIKLTRQCQETLQKAEDKVQDLLKQSAGNSAEDADDTPF